MEIASMAVERSYEPPPSRPARTRRDGAGAADRPDIPTQETQQPDPMLQMSTGKIGPAGLTLVALCAAAILGAVFYGLNGPDTERAKAGATGAGPAVAANNPAPPTAAPPAPQQTGPRAQGQ